MNLAGKGNFPSGVPEILRALFSSNHQTTIPKQPISAIHQQPMRVSLISTNGPWLHAVIATPYGELTVMDEFSISESVAPSIGSHFDVELSAFLDEDESWEAIFSGNPGHLKKLHQISGWRYRAFGQIVSIAPVTVDCGCIHVPDVIDSHDPRVIGEYISFTISRLAATML